ncbi:MAG: hypothetical protein GC157_10355 [Frankiales bacterium]|nr:hypothetical protein [Frankiales bacterium]
MTRHRLLGVVAGLQVATAFVALRYAVERELSMDALGVRREGRDIARDAWFIGTGITPPLVMMAAQATAGSVVMRRPSAPASRVLGALGAVMAAGYLLERESRSALTRWDPRLTPLTAAGVALTAPMMGLGLRRDAGPAGG